MHLGCDLFIGSSAENGFRCCLSIGIEATRVFGCCKLIGITAAIDFRRPEETLIYNRTQRCICVARSETYQPENSY